MTNADKRGLLDDTRGPVLGTWIKLPAPEVIEIASLAGFDFIAIDLEHTMLNLETVATMIGLARLANLAPLVRVPDHGHSLIQRVLDAGAGGVLVPQVDDVEQARRIVRQTKFPPMGTRGLSTSGRGGGWGAMPTAEYTAAGNSDCLAVVQLESEVAVRDALKIASVPGIDAVFLGPMDLSASMGLTTTDQRYRQLVSQLERQCASNGIALGTASSASGDSAKDLLERGYRMLVLGSDATLLREAAAALVQSVQARSTLLD